MKAVIDTISILLVVAWAVSYFVYAIGTEAHLFLFFAIVLGVIATFKKA